MNKTRVLLLHNVVAPYRLPLFEELGSGFELEVFFCKTGTKDRKWKGSLENYSFKNRVLPEFDLGPFFVNYTLPFELLTRRYDLYLAGENPENVLSTFAVLLFARLFGKPIVIWSEAINTDYSRKEATKTVVRKAFGGFVRLYRKLLYFQADAFVAYSRKAKELLVDSGVPEERIFQGIQVMPEKLLPGARIEKAGTPRNGKTIVLFLGYLTERKGVQYLIKAFSGLDKDDSRLIIAGSGPSRERLERIAGYSGDIRFAGYVTEEEKAKYYSMADVFVLPTLHDPWGLVVNEAMHYGLPVVVTNAAAASEMVEKTGNGFVIPPADVKSLRDCLDKLLGDEALRKRMGEESLKFADACDTRVGIMPFVNAIEAALSGRQEKR